VIWKRYILRREGGGGYFAGMTEDENEPAFTMDREKAHRFLDAGQASGMAAATGCNVIEIINRDNLEPMEPDMEGGGTSWFYVCGDCHGVIDWKAEKCRHCGRPVKWGKEQWVRT